VYVLYLNDVRMNQVLSLSPAAAASNAKPVLRASSKNLILKALEELRVKPYKQRIKGLRDSMNRPVPPITKHFKKGSPLEFCALPPDTSSLPESLHPIRYVGDLDDWLVQTRKRWEEEVLSIPAVTRAADSISVEEPSESASEA
jgi:hypothetical protein